MLGLAACSLDSRTTGVLSNSPLPFSERDGGVTASGGAGSTPVPNDVLPAGGAGGGTPEGPPAAGPPVPFLPPGAQAMPKLFSSGQQRLDFGAGELHVTGATLQWGVTYAADNELGSGELSLSNSNPADFPIQSNGCTASLAPGGSCSISVTFNPQLGGTRTGTLGLSSANGGQISVDLAGNAQLRVTVVRSGPGADSASIIGSENAFDSGALRSIDCGSQCEALFNAGAPLTLEAELQNGTDTYFAGWSDARCNGPARRCTLTVDDSLSIVASFPARANDLAFISSASYPTNLGDVALYDANCNALASAAGINTAAGNGFIAALASTAASLRDRLLTGATRGWLRMDGLPFTDDATALFDQGRVLYPVRYDERGGAASPYVMLGIDLNGTTNANCDDWTSISASSTMLGGSSTGGPYAWAISIAGNYCEQSWPVLCLGMTHTAPVNPPVTVGKRAWLTNAPFVFGSGTPDERCQADRPAGVNIGVAFIAYTGRAASDVLDPNATYVRPDGQSIGTGAEIAAGKRRTGIWQLGTGDYASVLDDGLAAWSGSYVETALGTADSTCDDWTSASGYGILASVSETSVASWFRTTFDCQNGGGHLYCIER